MSQSSRVVAAAGDAAGRLPGTALVPSGESGQAAEFGKLEAARARCVR